MSEKKINEREATKLISKKLEKIGKLFDECEEIAKEAGVYFSFDGPAYGMGGGYSGKADEWMASSQSC